MLNRREFLKTAGLIGMASLLPNSFWTSEAKAALLDNVNYVQPPVMPQIIHIFLYGGPSELAGNLTNMDLIRANSQNPYPSSLDPNNANNDITPNDFWGNAGGSIMEALQAATRHLELACSSRTRWDCRFSPIKPTTDENKPRA